MTDQEFEQQYLESVGLGGGSTTSAPASTSTWETWIQKAGNTALGIYKDTTSSNQNFELQKLKMQSMNPYGQYYKDGQPMLGGAGGMNTTVLILLGVGVLAVFLLKD